MLVLVRPGATEILFRVRDRLIPPICENVDPFLKFDPVWEKLSPRQANIFEYFELKMGDAPPVGANGEDYRPAVIVHIGNYLRVYSAVRGRKL